MAATPTHGAWRDRTNLFLSYRQSYAHHPTRTRLDAGARSNARHSRDADSERAGLMFDQDTAAGDAVIEMDLLPPRWLDMQDDIAAALAQISTHMTQLEHLHAKHVLPGFDDESVKAREEREIERLTQDITRAFTTCSARIRRIDALVREQQTQQGGALSPADAKMARNLQTSLAARVSAVSTAFRKTQSAYLKKLRALGSGLPLDSSSSSSPRPGASPAAQNPYTDPALQASEHDRSSAQSTLRQQTQTQVRRRAGALDAAIDQREREIEAIAQGVIDLANMFQELNSMVIDQGSLLDRIDYNVERTVEHVKGAEKELQVATGYQKKGTRRKVILLLVLVVVGMVILLVIKPKRNAGAAPAPPSLPAPVPGAPVAPEQPGGGLPPVGNVVRMVEGVGEAHGLGRDVGRKRWEWKQRRRRRGDGLAGMPAVTT
ncbi:hypothetical protein LTR08_008050 [Meristemomyces frigidus]|nr:hypothetical protein LTR08_008050 [Meristemomyces frigidus]